MIKISNMSDKKNSLSRSNLIIMIRKRIRQSLMNMDESYLIKKTQGLVKGAILCFRNPYFYFRHGESTSASQLTSPASQKSKDLNKVLLL